MERNDFLPLTPENAETIAERIINYFDGKKFTIRRNDPAGNGLPMIEIIDNSLQRGIHLKPVNIIKVDKRVAIMQIATTLEGLIEIKTIGQTKTPTVNFKNKGEITIGNFTDLRLKNEERDGSVVFIIQE